jgi:hypothetical protein
MKDTEFRPFELKIQIDSRDTLLEMWHRLNISYSVVRSFSDGAFIQHPSTSNAETELRLLNVWYDLNREVERIGG